MNNPVTRLIAVERYWLLLKLKVATMIMSCTASTYLYSTFAFLQGLHDYYKLELELELGLYNLKIMQVIMYLPYE